MGEQGGSELQERVEWFRPEGLPGVEILSADCCSRLWRVYHETYTFCTVFGINGQSFVRYRGQDMVYSKGDTSFFEPGETHVTRKITAPGSFRVLMIHPKTMINLAEEHGYYKIPHFSIININQPIIYQAFMQLHRAVERKAPLLAQQSFLAQCVYIVLSNFTEKKPKAVRRACRTKLHEVRDHIYENCFQQIMIEELVLIASLSRYHLMRAFQEAFGLSLHQYQLVVRTAKIRRLLASGYSLDSVELGFADQSHLIRCFKKYMAVTPKQYLRMLK